MYLGPKIGLDADLVIKDFKTVDLLNKSLSMSAPTCKYPNCPKPVWIESNGRVHDFCGLTHANAARNLNVSNSTMSNQNSNTTPTGKTCKYQGCVFPVAVENGRVHDFCSKKHAMAAMNNQNSNTTPTGKTCKYQGCVFPVAVENGRVHDFCSKKHAVAAMNNQNSNTTPTGKICPIPNCGLAVAVENGRVHDFCSKKHALMAVNNPALKTATVTSGGLLTPLTNSNPKYGDLAYQFTSKWTHSSAPTIVSICKINCATWIVDKYQKYQNLIIQKRPDLTHKGHGSGGAGNEQRRFHGTSKMKCSLGLNGNINTCNDTDCGICGIINTGFKLSKAQSNVAFGRFGAGIYMTSTSSKSHGYNAGTSQGLGYGYRAMFVCRVIVGKGKKLLQDEPTLTSAPDNCDSVLGEVGGSLNYDEVVVYNEDAVLPGYLIIYRA